MVLVLIKSIKERLKNHYSLHRFCSVYHNVQKLQMKINLEGTLSKTTFIIIQRSEETSSYEN